MKPRRPRQAVPVGDTDPFEPTPARPVRCRARAMGHDTQFEPHHHPWGQLACCASGLLQVTVSTPGDPSSNAPAFETTTIVPPSRAVWIPPGARHAVTMLEASQLHTLYIDASVVPADWRCSRVLVVSPLLRELVLQMGLHADGGPALLVGAPWAEGGKLYNAMLLLDGGRIAGITRKHDLPNYGTFDEKRVFAAGPVDRVACVRLRGKFEENPP